MKNNIKILNLIFAMMLPVFPAWAEMDMGTMNFDSIQMEKMIDKAESTTSKNKRKKYLNEHMDIMMKQMESMSGMMSQHHKMDKNELHDPENMNKRMDMMQIMMKHMMRQQNMMMEVMK